VALFLLVACIGLEMVPQEGGSGSIVGGVSLDASYFDFGDVPVGETVEQALTLRSEGERVTVTLAVDDAETFLLSSTEVGVDGESVVRVGFVPAREKVYDGELTVLTEGGERAYLPLSGVGVAAGTEPGGNLSLSETSHAFGAVDIDDTEIASFTVTNTGDDDLRITDIESSAAVFTTSGTLSASQVLSPGASKVLEVRFRPTAEQAYSGTVTIASDDPDAPETRISVTGSGADACDICAPVIYVDAGSAITDFFSIAGVTTDERTVTLTNDGDLPLTVSSIRVKNDDWAPCGTFTIGGFRGSVTLDPYRSSTFTITYDADSTCVESSNSTLDWNIVHIESNDPYTPDWTIELGGIGLG
jgi:hypothetical protein